MYNGNFVLIPCNVTRRGKGNTNRLLPEEIVLTWSKFRIEIYSEPIRSIPKPVCELIRTQPNQSEKSIQYRLMQIGRKSFRPNPS